MASAPRLLRRLLLHYVRPLLCLLLFLPFSSCFQLRCPQCASLKIIGHIYYVPSSSLHAHDINMAEFASKAGMQIIVKLSGHVCACLLPLGQTSSRTRKDMQQITIQCEWTAPALRGTNKPPRTQSILSH